MKKPCKFILIMTGFIFLLASCKKEIPSKPNVPLSNINDSTNRDSVVIPITYSDYPTNYLQVGNYWVYDNGDSTSVESFIIKGEADTFYRLVHHYANSSYSTVEYRRVTDSGLLIDTLGRTVFDYSGLPQVTDSSGRREMKCRMYWNPYYWSDTTSTMNTECCQLTGKWYQRHGTLNGYDCYDYCSATEGYFLVRGIGIVEYKYSQSCPGNYNSGNKYHLLRFYVRH